MGLVAPVFGMLGYRLISRWVPGELGRVAGVAFGGWCATVAAALACAGQLAWSGTVAWNLALPAMVGLHLLIGLGEAVISALAYFAITRARPSLTGGETAPVHSGFLLQGLMASLGIALFVAPFACPWPDGLEAVASRLGFEHRAQASSLSVFGDYQVPGFGSTGLSTALAGALGSVIALGLALLLGLVLVRRRSQQGGP
jgi:cobalt/nickel transport system permease protein